KLFNISCFTIRANRMTNDVDGSGNSWASGNSLPDVVAALYYRYGLFLATHPAKFILLAISSFVLLSTPLWYLPLPGYLPQDYITPIHNYSVPPPAPEGGLQLSPSPTPTPLWYQGPPRAYIQQVVIRSTVTPWQKGITVGESVRGPLSSVFHLSQIIGDFQLKTNRSITLASECLLVEGVVRKIETAGPSLPHFNCLMLSPADLWGRDYEAFKTDQNVLLTIKSLRAKHEEETSIADILFGLPSKDVGISSNPHNPQVINYAITIALKYYSEEFIFGLEEELTRKFPTHQPVLPPRDSIVHVYFPSRMSVWEFLILIFYGVLFSSIYFSVLKMQGLCSKFGLAFSIMCALVASLCIAASVSAHFGLRPLHSRGKYVYPVLAALVGFENSMALVRTILSTPDHLDVKIRVAQGLAREGWTITKYFLSMITVVTISFFLFIPMVQEFCIYGSLVLLCDLYLQLLFITAVIAVDLHRSQDAERHKRTAHVNPLFRYPPIPPQTGVRLISQNLCSSDQTCVPNLHKRHTPTNRGEDILAPPQSKPQPPKSIPKRLRFTYFVARKRMFQRMFMCIFIGWIVFMIYTSELVTHITDPMNMKPHTKDLASVIFSLTNRSHPNNRSKIVELKNDDHYLNPGLSSFSSEGSESKLDNANEKKNAKNRTEISYIQLKQKRRSFARRLPSSHWPALFSYYNISLRGHYLSILPPILLSLPIPPEESKLAHNIQDPNSVEWIPLFKGLETITDYDHWQEGAVIIPSSPAELLLTAIFVIPALAVLIYATIALYRCVCSRNYAEWRSSKWGKDAFRDVTSQIIGEAVPLILSGHPHDVECLGTDGSIVVSSCLAGVICAWDSATGECLASINRFGICIFMNNYYSSKISHQTHWDTFDSQPLNKNANNNLSYLTSSPSLPSLKSNLPDLSSTINYQFTERSTLSTSANNFEHIRQVYENFFSKHCNEKGKDIGNETSSSLEKESFTQNRKRHHIRNRSVGDINQSNGPMSLQKVQRTYSEEGSDGSAAKESDAQYHCSPIWCLDCMDGFVYIGTGGGTLEVWDIYSSTLKCYHDDGSGVGITSLALSGSKIVASRLSGSIDILQVEAVNNCKSECNNYCEAKHKNSIGSKVEESCIPHNPEDNLRLVRQCLVKVHQQPITVLCCDKTRIITGSHDHTLKVLNLLNGCVLFTLHGHYGPITSVALGDTLGSEDPSSVGITVDFGGVGVVIASGAQDGSLCVWDFQTGACIYSVEAHDGSILTLTCTSSYILSLGADEKLCVWERFQGHLLNTLTMAHMYCNNMVMLTNRLLITSHQGSLTVWDITAGAPVRVVRLGDRDQTVFVRHLLPVAGSIVCDYGNQLRIVRLLVAEKLD
ncbi:Sterol regulatory element-binding protein cleavage-activating protein, partial [Armadillidium nasatum]